MAKDDLKKTWLTHKPGTRPCAEIFTANEDDVWILHFGESGMRPNQSIRCSRRMARLIARRIDQCLDETA